MSYEQDKELLKTIMDLTEKNPFGWKKTSSEDCFLFPLKKGAINFCKYLNIDNNDIISLAIMDSIGNSVNMLEVNSINQPKLYNDFLATYSQIKANISQYEMGRFNESLKMVSGSTN